MKGKTILYFDSGIGGLSIYNEVNKIVHNVNTIYVFDNAFFPYGILSESTVIERCTKIIQEILNMYYIDLIVIACNTASTIVLPHLRSKISIPIVGVVPAIKPAAQISKSKVIGLLATPGTVARKYTDDLISNYAKDCIVEKLGTSELVKYAELKLRHGLDLKKEIAKVLKPLSNIANLDVLVLGCTHFPWLKEEINEILPQVQCIDSGEAIAKRVEYLLNDQNTQDIIPTMEAYLTNANIDDLEQEKLLFKKFGFGSLKELKV